MELPEIVRKITPRLRFIASRMRVRGAVDVDDMVQVGLLAAMKAHSRLDPSKGNARAFIMQRARGAMFDELRNMDHISRNYRRKGHIQGRMLPMLMSLQTSDPVLVPRDLPGKDDNVPLEMACTSDLWDAVRKLVRPKEMRVLELYYRGNLTLQGVAAAMGLTEGYVCIIVHRALGRIQRKWKRA